MVLLDITLKSWYKFILIHLLICKIILQLIDTESIPNKHRSGLDQEFLIMLILDSGMFS